MEAGSTDSVAYRHACAAISAPMYHLTATTLSEIGETDVGWIAAERAMQAAAEAGDPLALALSRPVGHRRAVSDRPFDDAVELCEVAARWLSPRMVPGDPAVLCTECSILAVAASRHQDRSTADELLTQPTARPIT